MDLVDDELILSPETLLALDAANVILVEHCFECLREVESGGSLQDTVIAEYLPRPFLHRYDTVFIQKYLVCLASVGLKLRLDETLLPGSTAEDLALYAMKQVALEDNYDRSDEMQDEFDAWEDAVFEDMDHELLYNPRFDGIEESDVAKVLGIARLKYDEWFVPFDAGVVSPYSGDASP